MTAPTVPRAADGPLAVDVPTAADVPLACSLPSAAYEDRAQRWQRLLSGAVRTRWEGGYRVRLPAGSAGEVAELVVAAQQ